MLTSAVESVVVVAMSPMRDDLGVNTEQSILERESSIRNARKRPGLACGMGSIMRYMRNRKRDAGRQESIEDEISSILCRRG